jgi:ADP-ribosyl-[dinitrogen reductase] hydrolase
VLGAFVGDASGAVLEFIGQKKITDESVTSAMKMPGGGIFGVGPGQITDDSEMAMCLLHATNDDHQHLNLNKITENFGKWYESKPFDIGNTTQTAMTAINLKRLNPTSSFKRCERDNKGSQSNGCLMRLTPFAVWAKNLNKQDLFIAVKL